MQFAHLKPPPGAGLTQSEFGLLRIQEIGTGKPPGVIVRKQRHCALVAELRIDPTWLILTFYSCVLCTFPIYSIQCCALLLLIVCSFAVCQHCRKSGWCDYAVKISEYVAHWGDVAAGNSDIVFILGDAAVRCAPAGQQAKWCWFEEASCSLC